MTYKKSSLLLSSTLMVAALVMGSPSAEAMKKTVITIEQYGSTTTAKKNPFGVSDLSEQDKNIPTQNIVGRYRVQLFSIDKATGKQAAHAKLEEMKQQDDRISYYPAVLATEKGSKWIRGQIGPFQNSQDATHVASALQKVFTKDLPTIVEPGTVHQKNFELESIEKHNW